MDDSRKRRIKDISGAPGTLIGPGCKFEGRLSGRGNFMISGRVEGDCDIEGTVTLTREGYWQGTIRADAVIIAGELDGGIEDAQHVEIGDTGKVAGTVCSNAIAVAEGAIVEGVMQTSTGKPPVEFTEKRQPDAEDAD